MSMLTENHMLAAIKGEGAAYELLTTATFTTTGPDGELLGFASGSMLTGFLRRILATHLGPINQERIRRLRQLMNEKEKDLAVYAWACVDPLVDGLCGPDSHVVQFCHRVMVKEILDLDREFWWTPTLHRALTAMAEDLGREVNPHAFGRKASTLNYTLYHFVGRADATGWLMHMPLEGVNEIEYRSWLVDVAHAVLLARIEEGPRSPRKS